MTNRAKAAAGLAALAAAAGGAVAGVQLTGSSSSSGPCYVIPGVRVNGVYRYAPKWAWKGVQKGQQVERVCMTKGFVKPPAKAVGFSVTVAGP